MNEEEIWDEGYYQGLAVAWQHMFSEVLGQQIEFLDALKALAILRDQARNDFERHSELEDNCICECDEINLNCPGCF